jgi:lambda family phage minor tail protein L
MKAEGFEMTTRGAIPMPSVTISNLFGAANSLLEEFSGLLGAKLTRILTLRRFLDDGSSPDPNAFITRDVFVVSQKISHNAMAIVFKLASAMDQQGVQVPRRQIMRDYCSHVYRVWNPALGAFDYSKATCPYTGGAYFDPLNNPTIAQLDQCSRDINGCKLRFGSAPLPAYFFPGVGRVK